jgi:hypothetical protein
MEYHLARQLWYLRFSLNQSGLETIDGQSHAVSRVIRPDGREQAGFGGRLATELGHCVAIAWRPYAIDRPAGQGKVERRETYTIAASLIPSFALSLLSCSHRRKDWVPLPSELRHRVACSAPHRGSCHLTHRLAVIPSISLTLLLSQSSLGKAALATPPPRRPR